MSRFFSCILVFIALEGCADIEAQQQAAEEATRQAETAKQLEASEQAAKWESEQISVRAERAGKQAAIRSEFESASFDRQQQIIDEQQAEVSRLVAIEGYKKGKVSDLEYQAALEAAKAQLDFAFELITKNSRNIDQNLLP